MSTTNESVLDQLKAAIAARRDSLEQLRGRIETLIEPIPIGVVLADDQGEIGKMRRVCTGASQWSNRTWSVTIKGKGLVATGDKLISAACRSDFWDGNNLHTRSTEGFHIGNDSDGAELSWLSGVETREIAQRLPRAIERYIAECVSETTANEAV